MTDILLAGILLALGFLCAVTLVPRAGRTAAGLAPRRSGYSLPEPRQAARIPYYPLPLPDEATHVAFVMMGETEHGSVYSLSVQPIEDAEQEVRRAVSWADPPIQKAIQLEDDLHARGCRTAGDLRFCVVKIDADGNQRWWSGRKWVPRWHRDAALFDIWGDRA
jgi:hypothetical protein